MLGLVDINNNYTNIAKYTIKLFRVNTKVVTKDLLKSSHISDITSILISSQYYINETKNLTQEKVENVIFPSLPSPLQQEFKSWHDKLSHLHPKYMLILENFESYQQYFKSEG